MSDIWFIADTHFAHDNIVAYCARPFADVDAMNAQLIRSWNEMVDEDDYVVHVGDVAMGLNETIEPLVSQLHGRKLLVQGNHDTASRRRLYGALGWRVIAGLVILGDVLVQHRYLPGEHEYARVIHGHAHGTQTHLPRHIDVGVDVNWDCKGAPLRACHLMDEAHEAELRSVLGDLFA
jgi:calcineurin-like phosphoesterase family protein